MIIDKIRDIKEFEDLYNSIDHSNLPKVTDLINTKDYLFCFYEENLLGCIYLELRNKKIFLSGFSKPKQLNKVIEAINHICNYFKEDIYSDTPFKHAKLVLIRCGFKKITENILKRSKQYGKFIST